MRNIILFDSESRNNLLPLTATRPMGELRVGILTLREKWERRLKATASYITQDYLQEKFPINIEDDNLIINAGILADDAICSRVENLKMNEALLTPDGDLAAARISESQIERLIEDEELHELAGIDLEPDFPLHRIEQLYHLNGLNQKAIEDDFALLTRGRKTQPISSTNRFIGSERIFVEEGAKLEFCTLNATTGPIYIGKNVELMEGGLFRGPIAFCDNSVTKMGAKIYGPTTIGPGCKVGGEVTRSIFFGNSNKAHDGYLGDSILGEWCNLGADTNTSNMKNNYAEIKLWNYEANKFLPTGLRFFGLVMGDHSKAGINTMFNSGSVVGVSANVYGAGYLRNFIPDFAWGSPESGYKTYRFADACDTAEIAMQRRNLKFTDLDKAILYHIYDRSAQYRAWDK